MLFTDDSVTGESVGPKHDNPMLRHSPAGYDVNFKSLTNFLASLDTKATLDPLKMLLS